MDKRAKYLLFQRYKPAPRTTHSSPACLANELKWRGGAKRHGSMAFSQSKKIIWPI